MSVQNSRNRFRSPNNPDTNFATHLLAKDAEPGFFESDFRYLNKRKHYQYLKELNSGKNISLKWYNDRVFTYEIASDFIDALSAHLELTPQERDNARSYFINLDREKLGLESHLVAYCVCAYVVHENDNDERACHPNVPDDKKDELFRQMVESLDLNQKAVVKTYCKIENRVPETPPFEENNDRPDFHLLEDGGI